MSLETIEDIRAALDRATERLHADASEAQQLATAARSAAEALQRDPAVPDSALRTERLRAETILAICMSINGQIHQSIQTGLALLEHTTDTDLSTRARLLNMLGVNYDLLEQHDDALEEYIRCLAIQRALGDSDAIARVLGNIGVVYSRIGDERRALEHLQEAIQIGQGSGEDPGRLARHTLNAAISLRRLGQPGAAAVALSDAEHLARQAGHQHTLAYILLNRCDFSLESGDTAAALADLDAAEALASRLPGLRGTLQLKRARALRGADRDAAIEAARSGLVAAGEQDASENLAQLHELLSELHEEAGDYKTALHHHRLLLDTRSALILRAQDTRIANLQNAHELERTRRERDWLIREREVLSELNARLVDLDRDRKELLSIAAHDIRSPLSLVSVVADLMSLNSILPDEIAVTGVRLKAACNRTLAIIDNLLSVRALETGERDLKLQTLDPIPVLSAVLTLLRPIAARKSIHIQSRTPDRTSILADSISLEQILDNLINNAIKFTPPGGQIQIQIEPGADTVSFIVRDTGPGLRESDQHRLFQKYARLSARPTGGEPSTGLGLYITRQLVELMSGNISARNTEQGGALFQVTLPCARRTP
jgi:signal transduction histidine kinase